MPLFNREDEIQNHPLDFSLLSNGSINFYHNKKFLQDDIDWLIERNYEIISFDCLNWKDKDEFYSEFSEKMKFPEKWPATNLDALDDWMGDIIFNGNGKVLVFFNFDHFLKGVEERVAMDLLDILENQSHNFLLFGNKLITLLHTNNPGLGIWGLDSKSVKWNSREWMYKSRGITENDLKIYKYKREM